MNAQTIMTDNELLLTAIIPFHSAEQFLHDSESWRFNCDTWQSKVQVILVWDSDNRDKSSRKQIENCFSEFDNLELVEGYFAGPGSSRNVGLALSRGKWITFWDADDQPFPLKLISILEVNSYEGIDYVVTGYNTFALGNGSRNQTKYLHSRITADSKIWCADGLGIWRIIFRKSSVKDCLFPNISMGEDLVFFIRFLAQSPKREFNDMSTYSYRVNSKTQLTSNREIKRRDSMTAFLLAEGEVDKCDPLKLGDDSASLYVRLFLAVIVYASVSQKVTSINLFTRRVLLTLSKSNYSIVKALARQIRVNFR